MEATIQIEKPLDVQPKKQLKAVQRLKSNFERSLKEVQILSQSLRNALDEKQATRLDCNSLEEEFKIFKERWRKYEQSVDEFKSQMEQEDLDQETADSVDQSFDEATKAYLQIKLEVVGILRVMHHIFPPNKQSREDSAEQENDNDYYQKPRNTKVTSTKKKNVERRSLPPEEPTRSQGSSIRKNAKRVMFGILIILLAYFAFFLVISFSVKSSRLQDKG